MCVALDLHSQPLTTGDLSGDAFRLFRDLPFIGMCTSSPTDKRWLQVNQTLCDMLGYTREELLATSWDRLTHPEDLGGDLSQFERVIRGDIDAYTLDKRYIRKDGRTLHALLEVRALRGADGQVEMFLSTIADITARVEAEREARDSAALLRQLAERAPGILYQLTMHADGRVEIPFASAAMEDMLGLAPSELQRNAASVFDHVFPDDLPPLRQSIRDSALALTVWSHEFRVVRDDQSITWLRGDSRPERLPGGAIRWHGFITDSTAWHRQQEALAESEARNRVQFEQAPEAIVVFDADDFRIVDANPQMERLFGVTRERLIGAHPIEFCPERQPDGRSSLDVGMEDVRRVLAGEVFDREFLFRHIDGRLLPCEIRQVRLPVRGRNLLRASILDIEERQRHAKQVARLRMAIDSSHTGLIIGEGAPGEYAITYVNPAFLTTLGYDDAHDVLGRQANEFLADPTDRARLEAILSVEGRWVGELVARRRDGTLRTLQVNLSTTDDASGRHSGLLAAVADITETKRLQQELRQAQKLESIGRLAGGVAHDFNNLLTVIKGSVDLALVALPADHAVRSELADAARAAESAARLTQQLLTFSRKLVPAPAHIDLNETVERISEMLRRVLGEDITLRTDMAPDLGVVHFDPGQAEQILMNLVANARDAMPGGGVLTIETRNVIVDAPSSTRAPELADGEYVLLVVRDSGTGMSEELMSHAFEPFFTTKATGKGTGLGLAVIHGAVEQGGGRVQVHSTLGQGTSFHVYLPRVHRPISAVPVPAEAAARPPGHETILLVEDDRAVRQLITRLLTQQGYRVFSFDGGTSALEWLNASDVPVDLLFTDVIMPGLNGKELADIVRTLRPGTRVLFASGYTDNVIAPHGGPESDVPFLAKPFSVHELAARVRDALGG